jgi:hypothetical protein
MIGGESTAMEVHATLCAMATAEAATHTVWAEYATVLLDPETAAFFGSASSCHCESDDEEA